MLLRYLGSLDKKSWQSTVLTLLTPGALGSQVENMNIRLLSLEKKDRRAKFFDLYKLRNIVRKEDPDLFHGWMYHGNLAASIGSMMSRRSSPVVWSIHHSLHDLNNETRQTRWTVRVLALISSRTAAISYCSRVSADQHEKIGFDANKRVIIPNGIDCDEFHPSNSAKEKLSRMLHVPKERFIVGNIARFHAMKDQVRLVEAIKRLLQEGYDVQGLFIGEGHKNGAVQDRARELDIEDRISIFGIRNDIPSVVPGMDVYALTSAWGEAFPLAVAEAMASGVPAVVTDVGDCSWLVGDTGIVVPPRDTEAIVAALKRMLDLASEERKALGREARKRVSEKFSLRQYVTKHQEIYEATLARRKSGTQIAG